jgi:hypothetical protein
MAGGHGKATREKAMNYQKIKLLVVIVIVLISIGVLVTTNIACEGKLPVQIINQTDQNLTVFINNQKIGDVKPNEKIKNKVLSATFREYVLEAKNFQGEVIFSKTYTFDQLSRDLNWIIIIPKP